MGLIILISLLFQCLLLQNLVIFGVTAICSADDDDERWTVAMFVAQRGERSDVQLLLVLLELLTFICAVFLFSPPSLVDAESAKFLSNYHDQRGKNSGA